MFVVSLRNAVENRAVNQHICGGSIGGYIYEPINHISVVSTCVNSGVKGDCHL